MVPAFLLDFCDLLQTLEEQITRYFHDIGEPPEETLSELETAPRLVLVALVLYTEQYPEKHAPVVLNQE